MNIILIYKNGGNGQVAFAANRQAPERHYAIVAGVATLAGYEDDILHQDATELLNGDAYRMPTPAEQETLAHLEQLASQIQESVSEPAQELSSEETEQGEQTPPDTAEQTDTPPALQNKKKASGG